MTDEIKLKFAPTPEDVTRAGELNPDKIENLMIRHPSEFAVAANRCALSHKQVEMVALQKGVIESELYQHYRKELLAEGDKPTEKLIDSLIKQDPRWKRISALLIEASRIEAVNKNIVTSLVHKKDMLVQISVNRREEIKSRISFSE